jgi:metal-dependent amidase/aminoacylase/carboxypeptidase family protein
LSFGKINTVGGATNVIPKKVEIEGTFRTMDEKWRNEAHELIEKICEGNSKSYGVKCELKIVKGYPCLYNDEHVTQKVMASMVKYLGHEHVHTINQRMTSEDFAYYTQEIPGCFYRLGIANIQQGIVAPVHNSTFNVDEKALITGSGMLAWLAIDLGNNLK